MIDNKIYINEVILINVRSNKQLNNETIKEIKELNLPIYFNDSTGVHWSFDTKLNNGYWLENISYNNDLTNAQALINN